MMLSRAKFILSSAVDRTEPTLSGLSSRGTARGNRLDVNANRGLPSCGAFYYGARRDGNYSMPHMQEPTVFRCSTSKQAGLWEVAGRSDRNKAPRRSSGLIRPTSWGSPGGRTVESGPGDQRSRSSTGTYFSIHLCSLEHRDK